MHGRARSTFHFSRSALDALELNEELECVYTEDKERERNAARQQAYRFNRYCKQHNINKKLSIRECDTGLTIKRVV